MGSRYELWRDIFPSILEPEPEPILESEMSIFPSILEPEPEPEPEMSVVFYLEGVPSVTRLFGFFCDKASVTVSWEALIGEFLRAKQSGKYTEDACKAFSDWFILSTKPRKPSVIQFFYGEKDADYDLGKDQFETLAKDEDFKRLCLHLRYWYKYYKRRTSKISVRSLDPDLLPLDKTVAIAESGILRGHADSIQEGLVVDGGEIPVPNVSSYVLSQVILFLEKKQHFQENMDKAAAHYEAWKIAFFNRNSHIISDLEQAAETLEIPSLLESVNKELKRKDGRHLNDNLSTEMFHYFCGMAGNNKRSRAVLEELNNIKLFKVLDKIACENFRTWFTQIGESSGRDHHNEFKTLMKSPDFTRVCLSLYWGDERVPDFAQVSLRSRDGKVLKINKSVAIDESEFLRRCVRGSGWWSEIPVPVSIASSVLSSTIDFCYKVWDFHKTYDSRWIKKGLVVVDSFRGWATEFLKSNIDILPEFYEAADFLDIPSLLLLTTEEVTDLVTRPLDKASVLCGKLSFSRMLSSLFVRVTE
ncbi:hypothetical protein PIB30_053470 [Stylosanthes scabra]|uniref:Uncharacterized protein n=1 Tax=Stylosanthes scabra TaxID=79078 RepID=A0ABU6WK53_9FABA|nr:hypothetical protein [Stylosanthes scabra]